MKIGKLLKKIFLTLFILLVAFLLITFIYHKIASHKESIKYQPPGEMVEVNGHNIHVYIEGNGPVTLVFMAGGGTSSPLYDFKPLWKQLTSEYKIVVVEKAGYGYSDVSDASREIDVILSETREALRLAEINLNDGVFLVPHSMSGIEAIRWAQKYPSEIKGIIGLDPAVPEVYEVLDTSSANIVVPKIMSRMGLLRLLPSIFESSAAVKSGELTQGDIDAYRSLFNRKTLTKDMLEEVKEIQNNAQKVKDNGVPNIPVVFFISNGQEVGVETWGQMLKDYVNNLDNGSYREFDCGHYVHNEETDLIIQEIHAFISDIESE